MIIDRTSRLLAYYKNSECGEIDDCECDIAAYGFLSDTDKSVSRLKEILKNTKKPLMLCGCGKENIDSVLLPALARAADRECIISYATEKTYKNILPTVIEKNHYLVLKTPIDINLAKELNILVIEHGLPRDRIIMNTDIGALGYGYEYGYSMIEKICLEKDDEYLNFPIISEAANETIKTKESKLGQKYSKMLELTAVSGALAAGANICTVTFSDNIKTLKEVLS